DFWPVDAGGVNEIFVELDESLILVSSWHFDAARQQYFYRLTRLGRDDGAVIAEQVDTPWIDERDYYQAMSLPSLYRSQHGRAPVVDGVEPSNVQSSSTLPRIEVTLPSNVVSGVPTTLEVRARHPQSGATLRLATPGVRFDPRSSVTIFLKS